MGGNCRSFALQTATVESAQNTFLLHVWEIVEEALHIKSVFQFITSDNFEEIEARPYHGDVFLVPMSDFTYRKDRLLMPFFKNWYEVYIKKDSREDTPDFYIENFPMIVWITEIALVTFLPCMFWATYFIYRRYSIKIHKIGYCDCIFHVLSLITNQGPATEPTSISFRFLSFIITVFAFLISIWYSSLLIASQAISIEAPALSSLDDVKTQRTHQLCTADGSWSLNMFRTNILDDEAEFRPEWKELINGLSCQDDQEDLLRITCKRKVVSLVLFKHFTHTNGIRFGNECLVVPFKEEYFNELALIPVGARFPYKRSIDIVINRMRDFGLMKYLWIKTRTYIPPVDSSGILVPVVTFGHVFELLVAYLVCISFSFIIMLFEKLIYKLTIPSFNITRSNGPNSIPYNN